MQPAAKATEIRLHTFSQFSLATLHVQGCRIRRGLQQDFARFAPQSRGLGGDVRLKSGEHMSMFLPVL